MTPANLGVVFGRESPQHHSLSACSALTSPPFRSHSHGTPLERGLARMERHGRQSQDCRDSRRASAPAVVETVPRHARRRREVRCCCRLVCPPVCLWIPPTDTPRALSLTEYVLCFEVQSSILFWSVNLFGDGRGGLGVAVPVLHTLRFSHLNTRCRELTRM